MGRCQPKIESANWQVESHGTNARCGIDNAQVWSKPQAKLLRRHRWNCLCFPHNHKTSIPRSHSFIIHFSRSGFSGNKWHLHGRDILDIATVAVQVSLDTAEDSLGFIQVDEWKHSALPTLPSSDTLLILETDLNLWILHQLNAQSQKTWNNPNKTQAHTPRIIAKGLKRLTNQSLQHRTVPSLCAQLSFRQDQRLARQRPARTLFWRFVKVIE